MESIIFTHAPQPLVIPSQGTWLKMNMKWMMQKVTTPSYLPVLNSTPFPTASATCWKPPLQTCLVSNFTPFHIQHLPFSFALIFP